MEISFPVDTCTIIPHRPPMLFIPRVDDWHPEGAHAELLYDGVSPFSGVDNELPAFVLIEWCAQLCAAYAGIKYLKEETGKKAGGYFVGLNSCRLSRSSIPSGSRVSLSVSVNAEVPPFLMFSTSVRMDGELILDGDVKVFERGSDFSHGSGREAESSAENSGSGGDDPSSPLGYPIREMVDQYLYSADQPPQTVSYALPVSEDIDIQLFRFPKDFTLFQGHFPDQAVLPGITLFYLLHNLLEKKYDKPMWITSLSRVKFVNTIEPDNVTIIEFRDKGSTGSVFVRKTDGSVSASFNLSYSPVSQSADGGSGGNCGKMKKGDSIE